MSKSFAYLASAKAFVAGVLFGVMAHYFLVHHPALVMLLGVFVGWL